MKKKNSPGAQTTRQMSFGPVSLTSPSRLVSFVPGLFLVIVVVVAVVVAVIVVVFVVVVWCVCFGGGSRVVTLCDSTRHGCEHC